MSEAASYKAIVIGTSAGGLYALIAILRDLPATFPLPIIVVQHRSKDQRELLEEVLQTRCRLAIKQADEKEAIEGGVVYIAPPDYHLLVENDHTLSLSADEPVRFSRPSIDVLFETAAAAFSGSLIGMVLTGASNDGAAGISAIKKAGGLTIAQDPNEALFAVMPSAAIETKNITFVKTLQQIHDFLLQLTNTSYEKK
ncbi:chemotaxis protein CheB [Ferruginibacter sp.]